MNRHVVHDAVLDEWRRRVHERSALVESLARVRNPRWHVRDGGMLRSDAAPTSHGSCSGPASRSRAS